MKYLLAVIAVLVLVVSGAVAQQQYPQQQYPQQNTQQYPQQQYPQNSQQNSQQNSTYSQTAPSGPQTVDMRNGMIPSGTQLAIRTDEQISADSQSVGQTYQAEIAQDVVDQNGRVVIPRGAQARLTIANVSSGTMGVGNNQVALALQSVNINGRDYMLQTNTQNASGDRGIGKNKRTGEYVGGGAVLGTVIGAIAGGAKGAVIGAIAGGAAGGGAQVLTRGKEVKVPAESVLTFRLDQPVQLNSYQQPNNSYPNSSYPNSYPPQRR
jgi:hypothetical protein